MSDSNKSNEIVERSTEKKPLLLEGRVSTDVTIHERNDALSQNPDKSDGSLQKYADRPIARSIEIHAVDLDGRPVKIDKTSLHKERNLARAGTDESDLEEKAQRKKHERISRSIVMLAYEARENPVLEPIREARNYAERLPEDHPDKEKLTHMAREQAAEFSQNMRDYYQQKELGEAQMIGGQEVPKEVSHATKKDVPLENTPEGWQELARRIGELTPDQQMQLALNLIQEQQKIEREKAIGGLVGIVEGTQSIVGSLCDFFQFAGDCLVNQKRAQESVQKTAESLIQCGVAGVQLLEVAAVYGVVYADEVIESGDPAKPLKDAYLFGQQLEKSWAGLSDYERSRRLNRFATEAFGMMIPGPQLVKLGKAGTVAKILRVVTEDLAEVGGDVKKATQALARFINDLRPPGLIPQTANGVPLENPGIFDHIKDAGKKLKEKIDELHAKMTPERTGEKPPKGKRGEYVDKGPPEGYKYDKPVAIEMARLQEHPNVKKLLASYAKTGKINDLEGQRVADTIAESLRPFCKDIDKANIAFGVITKDGKQTLVVATSNHSDLPGCLPIPKNPVFSTISEGYKYPTDHSEFRILDEFQRILKEDKNAKLALFTEEDCCRSCGPAIDQFDAMATKLLGKPHKLHVTFRYDDKLMRESWNKRRTDWQ